MDIGRRLNRVENFTFINPWIKYCLFFFSFLFWTISLVIVAIGVYAKIQKATDAVRDTFLIDPAIIMIAVGAVMFLITFCGCVGALRENIMLLHVFSFSLMFLFLVQLVVAILGFVYSDKAQNAVRKFIKKAIIHYRDDIDLQNLIDYIQNEFQCCGWTTYTDWSKNMYFNCTPQNPSPERCGVPYSCCIPVPGESVINTMCGFEKQRLNQMEASKFLHPVGCADKAVIWIEGHLFLVGGIVLGLALPQIAGIVLSRILIGQIKEEIKSI
ncbi:tetraspanin-33b isoform X1 [Callorhinchus milii]|uniref:Tetraspanin n=2 Tax=Callorhinchus milii TaxID=7868 RepID=A0A4W3K2Y9_CALMI|nr:tetraspanin-33b isoform X1 [Callorhinchus milii]XP_007896586.1 tetraspanin-33b isoform X1 [Callorhinchus milii]|eukprot:gi/632961127/ref/XP_007896585.1/ PREDICTED: tetraspanin-33-like [Callorhinchus milii]